MAIQTQPTVQAASEGIEQTLAQFRRLDRPEHRSAHEANEEHPSDPDERGQDVDRDVDVVERRHCRGVLPDQTNMGRAVRVKKPLLGLPP